MQLWPQELCLRVCTLVHASFVSPCLLELCDYGCLCTLIQGLNKSVTQVLDHLNTMTLEFILPSASLKYSEKESRLPFPVIPLLRHNVILPNWEKFASAKVHHTSSRFSFEQEKNINLAASQHRGVRSSEVSQQAHPMSVSLAQQRWGEKDFWVVSLLSALGQSHNGANPEGRISTYIRNKRFKLCFRGMLFLMSVDMNFL